MGNEYPRFDDYMLQQHDLISYYAHALLNALVRCDVEALADDEPPVIEEDVDGIESLAEAAEGVLDELGMGGLICRPYYTWLKSAAGAEGDGERIPCYLDDECGNPECPFAAERPKPQADAPAG